MAEASNTPMEEVSAKETIENPIDETALKMEHSGDDLSVDVSMEPANENESELGADKTNDGKKKYTEEERMKRKEYFKQLREKKRLAREKYLQKYVRRFPAKGSRSTSVIGQVEFQQKDIGRPISYEMTDEDNKMLDFYRVRLSTLRGENEELHKRLAYLVRENMRLLQSGPPTSVM